MTVLHSYDYRVSFGDCDPAGIAYYPNMFKWIDTTFHDWMRIHGGHATLCKRLEAIGIGLMESTAQFRTPLADGDALSVKISALRWGGKSLTVQYRGMVGERLAFDATEKRGLFLRTEAGLRAGNMADLRALVDPDAN